LLSILRRFAAIFGGPVMSFRFAHAKEVSFSVLDIPRLQSISREWLVSTRPE
jgi:hypothetical protein